MAHMTDVVIKRVEKLADAQEMPPGVTVGDRQGNFTVLDLDMSEKLHRAKVSCLGWWRLTRQMHASQGLHMINVTSTESMATWMTLTQMKAHWLQMQYQSWK